MSFRRQWQFVAAVAVCLGFLTVPTPASAQGVEIAGGYSYLKDLGEDGPSLPAGWFASVGGNVTDRLSILGEVSGNYTTQSELGIDVSTSIHTFMAGPRISVPAGTVTPFVQVLIGMARASASGSGFGFEINESETDFGVKPGGGIDVNISPNLGLRLGANFLIVRSEGETSNNLQFVAGLVYKLGS